MRAPEQESTATAALSYVEGDFRRIGWGPMANAFHDLGTDLFIQVRDERRFDRGLVVGAQVKGGPTWFGQPQSGSDGTVEGWWFYEASAEHFDDWVTHGLPHLVVLYDFESRTSYWVHVTAERCVSTGKGCKILVPATQTVDAAHLDALLNAATAQRAAGTFEQRVFHAGAASAPPARRLRYALLTPRLIAPHGNAGCERAPEPEEYLALLVRRRSDQVSQFRKRHPQRLDPSVLATHSDWRWQFAHSVGQWLDTEEITDLRLVQLAAPNSASLAAIAVVLAAHHVDAGEHAQAQELLDELIARDTCSPVDLAWLLVHRATVKAELGEVGQARVDAARATQCLRGDEDDPTAALLAGVAANILFSTAGFGAGDLEQVINSNDTAPSWWRAQMLSWALGHFDNDVFEEWLSDDRLRWNVSDEGQEYLEASRLNALLSSDHQAWRSIAARQGRHLTRCAHHAGDDLRLLQGLDQLRRAGDKDNLARAVGVVWQTGPLSTLRDLAELGTPGSITRGTAAATIKLWGAAADALPEPYANDLASWCLSLLSKESATSGFRERHGSTFRIDSAVLQALKSLLRVTSASLRQQFAGLLLAVPNRSIDAQEWAMLVTHLDTEAFGRIEVEALRAKAFDVEDHLLKDVLLYQLARLGDATARSMLIERSSHDLYALQLIPNRGELDPQLARDCIATLARSVARVRTDAAKGSYGFGGIDAPRLLIHFNLLHPNVADWACVFDFLSDQKVIGDHKEDTVAALAAHFEQLGDDVRERVQTLLPALLGVKFLSLNRVERFPEAAWELQVLADRSARHQQATVAAFLTGATTQRRVAASVLGRGVAPFLSAALYPMLRDDDRSVRASASYALGQILSRSPDPESWMPAVARVVNDDGALRPCTFLGGLSDEPFGGSPAVVAALEPLASHGSFRVRRALDATVTSLQRARP